MANVDHPAAAGGRGGGISYSNGYFVAAFILTSIIVAAGTCAAVLSRLWGTGSGSAFDFDRDMGWIIVAFFVCWAFTAFAGMILGVPVLLGLRKLGLDRRPEALLLAGLGAGTLFTILLGFAVSGDLFAVTEDPGFVALGAGAGLAAGAIWWLFAWRQWRKNG